jgi:uncharacterized protein YjiS (DUF1127 family)
MAAHTANQNFSFQLPSLSYVDAKWEEPNLHTPVQAAARGASPTGMLARLFARYRDWQRARQAMAEFSGMSDYELADIGLSRSDVHRVFDPSLCQDLEFRGKRA